MVGGRDFEKVKFNLASSARRQAGSAFKPFTLTAAVLSGITLDSVWQGSPKLTIPDPACFTDGKPWDDNHPLTAHPATGFDSA